MEIDQSNDGGTNLVPRPFHVFQHFNREGLIDFIHDVMMTYWMQYGSRLAISTHLPMQCLGHLLSEFILMIQSLHHKINEAFPNFFMKY